ncbi:hypothetical protein E2C01_055063 [Portunus trituberculatus]|uniref:Uncharacterized protein n=1 Tax=Portunus trituberculatus TaxID=210409 RepID=A0A5B7GLF9_PORTR|nr:hypothetical protein [Portunus trituberculatus]
MSVNSAPSPTANHPLHSPCAPTSPGVEEEEEEEEEREALMGFWPDGVFTFNRGRSRLIWKAVRVVLVVV